MLRRKKLNFKKADIVDASQNKNRRVVLPIVLVSVLAVIIFAFITYIYFGVGKLDFLYISTSVYLCSVATIIFVTFITIMMIVGTDKKRKGSNYFLTVKNKKSYQVVTKLSDDIDEIVSNVNPAMQFKEEQIEKQHNRNVNVVKTFTDFANFINEFFLNKGYKTDVGFELVASVAASPILFLNEGEHNDILLDNIDGCFNAPNLIIDANNSDNIQSEYSLFDAINTARSFKNSPVFLVIKNLDATKADSYLEPIKHYFNNRNNSTIVLSNRVVKIPNNLYVVISLKEGSNITLVNPELLKNATTFTFRCEEDNSIEDKNAKPIELDDFNIVYALNRVKNDSYLEEDYWKKIDAIEELLIRVGYPKFDNKMLSHLESYVSIAINSTHDQLLSLDLTLANLVLLPALTQCGAQAFVNDNDIIVLFNTLFEEDQMLKSREIMKDFFDHHDKEGNLL